MGKATLAFPIHFFGLSISDSLRRSQPNRFL